MFLYPYRLRRCDRISIISSALQQAGVRVHCNAFTYGASLPLKLMIYVRRSGYYPRRTNKTFALPLFLYIVLESPI